jgi:hypothetical protein
MFAVRGGRYAKHRQSTRHLVPQQLKITRSALFTHFDQSTWPSNSFTRRSASASAPSTDFLAIDRRCHFLADQSFDADWRWT